MNQDVLLSTLLIFSAACYLSLGVRLVAIKRAAGNVPMGALFMLISVWVMGGAIELLASDFAVFSLGRTAHFIGTALVPVAAFACFREYTGAETPSRTLILLMLIPLASVTLAATNANHEFMWFLPATNLAGEFLTRPDHWGPWFLFVHLPYSYILIASALLVLITHSASVAPAQRRGLFLLVAACTVPLATAVAYDLGYGPNTISFVPFAFVLMLPVYAWLVLSEQIIEFTPLAYETVFQNMQDPVVVIDENWRVIGMNHTAERMLSVTESGALRAPLEDIFGDEAPEVFEALNTGQPQKMLTSTGRFLHVQVSQISSGRVRKHGGKVLMFRDVSDVENAQSEVRKSEKLLRTLIDHSVNGIVRFRWAFENSGNRSLRSIFANAAAGRFLGADTGEISDCTAREIINLATSGMDDDEARVILDRFDAAVDAGTGLDVEVRHRHNGASRWLRMICEPVGDDIAATFVDITDSKAKERQMESIATSDPLTGVLNRRGFERQASRRLTNSADDATGALLFIDLNDFKTINDKYGHEIGDQLLTIASERLRKSLRSCDIIGRPGGDEFVALVPDVDPGVAEKLANRLTHALEEKYVIGRRELRCAASIGLALYPKNANTLTGLLREADQAMYRAKARCRGATNVASDDLLEKAI
ncbi:MAG TPA: diguanylate cyclase [Woeseiaceae bacterium]|nr:diguanylate cyclase [Woeseiaceae bacterium]